MHRCAPNLSKETLWLIDIKILNPGEPKKPEASPPLVNIPGELERSIGIIEHAKQTGGGARGLWGSQGIIYALILELGGQAGRALATTIPAFPYLRPAADAQYPGLARRIKKAFG